MPVRQMNHRGLWAQGGAGRLAMLVSLAAHAGVLVAAARLPFTGVPRAGEAAPTAIPAVAVRLVLVPQAPVEPASPPAPPADIARLPPESPLPAAGPPPPQPPPAPDPATVAVPDRRPDDFASLAKQTADLWPLTQAAAQPQVRIGLLAAADCRPEPPGAPPEPPAPLPAQVHAPAARKAETPEAVPPATLPPSGGLGKESAARAASVPRPVYPPDSRRWGEEGTVVLEVEVLPSGRPGTIRVLESPGHARLVAAAEEAVRAARFVPAARNGRPVRSFVRIPFTFRLQ